MKRLQKIISTLLLVCTLMSLFPMQTVYAASPSFTSAKMINFFQTGNDINMTEVSEGELRVYGVFLSNFFTPGETQVSDLKGETEKGKAFADDIAKVFLQNTNHSGKVLELNKIIYDASYLSLKNSKLTDSSGKAISGSYLLKAMSTARITDNDPSTKIYLNGQAVVMDVDSDAFRGAFKILAAQSAKFILDETYGIDAMKTLYIDCFGNIWGSYPQTVVVNNFSEEGETALTDLHLVLPACLNPISFYNTYKGQDLSNVKIPLNNAFAMGSLIKSDEISDDIAKVNDIVPYYNAPKYFTDDKYNVLYIYGLNSATPWVANTDYIYSAAIGSNEEKEKTLSQLEDETKKSINDFYSENFNVATNYKLIFSNRVNIIETDLEIGQTFAGGTGDERIGLVRYLYDTFVVQLDKTHSTLYYFGESTSSWAETEFKELGMTGVNMFAYKDGDKWIIHDNNQKTPLLTSEFKKNQTATTIEELNALLGISESKFYSEADSSVKGSFNNSSKIGEFFGFGNYTFVQGLSTQYDTKFYSALVNGSNVGSDFSTERQKFALYNTLNNYTISGAKYNGEKVKKDLEITINDSKKTTLTATNKRVGTEANWPGIFWGYMVDMFDMKNQITYDADGKPTYNIADFQSSLLPKLPDGLVDGGKLNLTPLDAESGVANSSNLSMEEMQKDLIKKIYGIISDEPNSYRDRWIKRTLDGFLIDTHKSITGSWISNVATVSSENMSSYSGVVGYIHTPSMYDLPFTSWFMNNYMQIYIIALLVVIVFIILMVLLSMRTWRQGVIIFVLMTVGLLLPNVLIENTVNIGNKVADSIYSDRFDFWALTQHQQSFMKLQGAGAKDSLDYLIASTGEQAKNVYSQESGVRVKWMAPKKSGVFETLFNNKYASEKLTENLTIFKWLFSSFVYQQEFVGGDSFATYLYRPYNSIASDALEYYELASTKLDDISADRVTMSIEFSNRNGEKRVHTVLIDKKLNRLFNKLTSEYSRQFKSDFYASAVFGDNLNLLKNDNVFKIYWSGEKHTDITKITNQYVKPSLSDRDKLKKESVSLWGLGNDKVTDVIVTDGRLGVKAGPDIPDLPAKLDSGLSEDMVQLLGFYKNTESPFYYFYNVLKYRYGDTSKGTTSFKNSLLNRDIWVVKDGNLSSTTQNASNAVRDFLDLEGLFTNIIPYMSMANNYVYGWTSIYGMEVPDYTFGDSGVSDDEFSAAYGEDDRAAIDAATFTYTELKTLKEGMKKVWNIYCPWVDQLNSLDIHNEKVGIGGKRVSVENTLNPSYYLKAGRPMIFSEADMIVKGYTVSDLSDIEKRIQRVLETTYRDLQYLVNYYDMEDEVLINAAAMYATFNFNREFSQNSIIGETVMLYPQGFEMKNFNYDAFMRLVMLNATGESLFSESGDLYERILSKTSFFTGLMLLISDIFGVIIIPTLKLLILLMLMFLGLLLCMTCVINPPEKLLQSVGNSLMIPALLFLISNIVFAFAVSLLVGDGITTYVGAKNISIATKDPTITICLMILINAIYSFVLFKIVRILMKNYKAYGTATLLAGLGVLGGVASAGIGATKKLINKTGKGIGKVGSFVGGAAVGSVMAGKGNRLRGALDGAMDGSARRVYNQRRKEERMAGMMGGNSLTNDINNKASGNGKLETKVSETNSNEVKEKSGNVKQSDKQQLLSNVKDGFAKSGKSKDQMIESLKSKTSGLSNNVKERAQKASANLKSWKGNNTLLGATMGSVATAGHKIDGAFVKGKENLRNGLHKANVNMRVAKHQVVQGAKETYNTTKNAVTTGAKAVGNAAKYVASKQILIDAKSAASKGLKYAGNGIKEAGKTVARGTKHAVKATSQYMNTSMQQARTISNAANKEKMAELNALYKSNRGYTYEQKMISKGKIEADKITTRRAESKVAQKDNKRKGMTNDEVKARIKELNSKKGGNV